MRKKEKGGEDVTLGSDNVHTHQVQGQKKTRRHTRANTIRTDSKQLIWWLSSDLNQSQNIERLYFTAGIQWKIDDQMYIVYISDGKRKNAKKL